MVQIKDKRIKGRLDITGWILCFIAVMWHWSGKNIYEWRNTITITLQPLQHVPNTAIARWIQYCKKTKPQPLIINLTLSLLGLESISITLHHNHYKRNIYINESKYKSRWYWMNSLSLESLVVYILRSYTETVHTKRPLTETMGMDFIFLQNLLWCNPQILFEQMHIL